MQVRFQGVVWGLGHDIIIDLNSCFSECKHLLTRILVTNLAARAPLSEVLNHPWMQWGYRGPPDPHLVHREPLRAEDLDRNVIRGLKGFEFGSEDEIENKLIEVLESAAY